MRGPFTDGRWPYANNFLIFHASHPAILHFPITLRSMAVRFPYFLLIFTLLQARNLQAQQQLGVNDTITVFATLYEDGSLVPTAVLPDAWCYGKMPKWMRKQMKTWTRLRNAVYVTYPYAKAAGKVIAEINASLAGITDAGERRRLIKQREKDLKKTFADKIINLSVYQGKVLMKLINRQSGSNCYEILEEYKGGANARLWQTVAFFFGSSLKQSYDPLGEDAEMEGIAREVELLYKG